MNVGVSRADFCLYISTMVVAPASQLYNRHHDKARSCWCWAWGIRTTIAGRCVVGIQSETQTAPTEEPFGRRAPFVSESVVGAGTSTYGHVRGLFNIRPLWGPLSCKSELPLEEDNTKNTLHRAGGRHRVVVSVTAVRTPPCAAPHHTLHTVSTRPKDHCTLYNAV